MSLHKPNGTRITLAAIADVTNDISDADPWVEIDGDITERTEYSGGSDATAATGDDKTQLAFRDGQVVRLSEVTDKLSPASISSFSPSTGLATAGGTTVTATGEGLDGVTAATVGGTAATSVTVVNPRSVTFVTPAKSAGTYTVVVTDDSGTVTKTSALTFA